MIARYTAALLLVLRVLLPDFSARSDLMARDAAEWMADETDLGAQTLINYAMAFGIPGPARSDLPSGGIIVSALMAADWVEIVAHEIGHYLGLFHVPDDPLPDTSAAECLECPRNLMEPRSAGVYLSPGEVYVILRHPIVHLK